MVTVAVALAIAGGLWVRARRSQDEADREARIAQVKQLVDTGRFVDVWRVARAGLQRWPGDPELEQMLHSTSQTVTLTTDPSGADLAFKAYDDLGGEWLPIGKSPLNGVSVPLGMLRWRITMSGFDPLEARLEVGTPAAAAFRPTSRRSHPAAPGRQRRWPHGVRSGRSIRGRAVDRLLAGPVRGDEPRVQIVCRPRGYDGRFRDGTGRPGPATWQLGTYPAGQDGYPVSGVSWFEADG